MELVIKRDQDKGFLGGMKFVLEAKAVLTEEESLLVKKYKAHKHVLFSSENRQYTIDDLTLGMKDKVKDVSILLQNEEVYINACESLKTMLDVMKSFGGEYKLEFRNDGVYNSSGEKIK